MECTPQAANHDVDTPHTPTCKIPDDVLFAVFTIIVKDEALPKYDSPHILTPTPAKYPWTLTAVCKQWRDVCLEGSNLWSYIDFLAHTCTGNPFVRIPPSSFLLARAVLQLERSRNTPLSIHIDFSCQCESQLSLWRAIIPHSKRWQVLRLKLRPPYTRRFHDVMSKANTVFSNLDQLHFIDDSNSRPLEETVPIPVGWRTGIFKNLQSVILSDAGSLESDSVGIPWDRLTSLTLNGYRGSFTPLILSLAECNSLIHLTLGAVEGLRSYQLEPIEGIKKNSVIMPHLTSLSLTENGSSIEKTILPFLQLPSLRHLAFGTIDINEHEEYNETSRQLLIDLIARSGCRLTELTLHIRHDRIRLDSLFKMTPQLRFLHLDIEGNTYLLRSIAFPQSDTYLCPYLEELRITCFLRDSIDTAAEHVVELATSRLQKPGTSLFKTLKICMDIHGGPARRRFKDKIQSQLDEFIKNGFGLHFSTIAYYQKFRQLPRIY